MNRSGRDGVLFNVRVCLCFMEHHWSCDVIKKIAEKSDSVVQKLHRHTDILKKINPGIIIVEFRWVRQKYPPFVNDLMKHSTKMQSSDNCGVFWWNLLNKIESKCEQLLFSFLTCFFHGWFFKCILILIYPASSARQAPLAQTFGMELTQPYVVCCDSC